MQRGPGAPEPPDAAVERLVSCGPDISNEREHEGRKRAVDLAKAVETAPANSLSVGGEARLREILNWHCNVFRCGLRGDPPSRVEPIMVTFKPTAKVVKARGRAYSPIKTAWLATCIGTLVAL